MGTAKQRVDELAAAQAKRFARIDWRSWDEDQNRAFDQTWIDRSCAANVPVPRRASCHYLAVDADPRNVYFY